MQYRTDLNSTTYPEWTNPSYNVSWLPFNGIPWIHKFIYQCVTTPLQWYTLNQQTHLSISPFNNKASLTKSIHQSPSRIQDLSISSHTWTIAFLHQLQSIKHSTSSTHQKTIQTYILITYKQNHHNLKCSLNFSINSIWPIVSLVRTSSSEFSLSSRLLASLSVSRHLLRALMICWWTSWNEMHTWLIQSWYNGTSNRTWLIQAWNNGTSTRAWFIKF